MQLRALSTLLLLIALSPQWALADTPGETDKEVQYLLEFVAGSGCDFYRNGSRHAPGEAANHLRMKYNKGKRYVTNAEQFIDRLATKSSWTGKHYTAVCAGQEIASGQWLHNALVKRRQDATPPTFP